MIKHILFSTIILFSLACQGNSQSTESQEQLQPKLHKVQKDQVDTATFAGGCFWCMEAAFEQVKGVYEVVSGYTGGQQANPTYKQVSYGRTAHAEAIQLYYNPKRIDYATLVDIFFVAHDPTQLNRQGPDVGEQYRSAIFYHNETQKQIARQAIQTLEEKGVFDKPIVTEINELTTFWLAESYHQDYEQKHPSDRYILNVSKPKILKVRHSFPQLMKEEVD